MKRETTQQRAGALWAFRARAELEAAARFRRLAHGLATIGSARLLVDMAQAAADDEIRHHERCVALARSFDAEAVIGTEPAARPLQAGSNDLRARILHELVTMSCITETLSTALLIEMRAQATDRAVISVVHEVLQDEVQHARLGWAHLAASASSSALDRLSERLPRMLSDTVHEEIFTTPDTTDAALASLGGLSRTDRCTIFVTTLREVVLPGLRHHGVDTRPALRWLEARLRPRADAGLVRARARDRGASRSRVFQPGPRRSEGSSAADAFFEPGRKPTGLDSESESDQNAQRMTAPDRRGVRIFGQRGPVGVGDAGGGDFVHQAHFATELPAVERLELVGGHPEQE